MGKKIPLFLFIAAFSFFAGCRTARQAATPSLELKKKAKEAGYSDTLVTGLLGRHPRLFDTLLKANQRWGIQVIYTQVNRDKNNKPSFSHHYYNYQPGSYFYPASTVKMPIAFLAAQKINELEREGLSLNSTMITEKGEPFQTKVYNDPSSEDGRPSIAQYIRKIFLVSDNDAFNRLYEFLGPDYINGQLHRMGYDSVQVIHRLSVSLSEAQNRSTNPVLFYDTSGRLLYQKPQEVTQTKYPPRYTKMGKGYMSRGKLVSSPFDFSSKNRFSLVDLHSILTSVIFPEAVPEQQRFRLKEEDYDLFYRYMSMKPGESRFPQYDSSYTDAYVKFLLFGGEGRIENKELRIFNKVGDAYGFLTDVAYIVDFEKGVEFLLSATIYCNSDGIFNDDRYDYNTIGFPFMKALGKVFYEYETGRKKKYRPDLGRYQWEKAK